MILLEALLVLTPIQAPPPDLGRIVDRACHWLRWSARNPDGSFGKTVKETAAALATFAESPRGYREIDGPWVRDAVAWIFSKQAADGSFGTAGEDPTTATALSLAAFGRLEVGHHEPERARARAFLEGKGVKEAESADPLRFLAPDAKPLPAGASKDEAQKAAEPLLAGRAEEGHWSGSVEATARAAILLSRCQKAIAGAKTPGAALPAPPAAPKAPPSKQAIDDAVSRGLALLMSKREKDGMWGFGGKSDLGISALCAAALLSTPVPRSAAVEEAIATTLDALAAAQAADGAVAKGGVASYVTSVSILAWVSSGSPKYRANVERGQAFLTTVQVDEGEGYGKDDRFYGGIGYGDDERPDLSNLNLAFDGLHASGLPQDHPAYRKAVEFLQRCQNRSESNPLEIRISGDTFVAGNDGGAAYFPGNSPAGYLTLEGGRKVARSYGSMTYALLKGYLFAGLPKQDPRVRAAFDWIRRNWTLDENPGFDTSKDPRAGYQGYFYYLYTLARTLRAYGEETVKDAAGGDHAWRAELASRLLSIQRPDGSWSNEVDRWYEGMPALVTAYALLTLAQCR